MDICLHKGYFLLLGDHKGEFPHFAGSFSWPHENGAFSRFRFFATGIPTWNSRRFELRAP